MMKKESIRDKKHGRERSKKIRGESCVDEKSNSTSSSGSSSSSSLGGYHRVAVEGRAHRNV